MNNNQKLQKLKQEIARTIELLREKHEGANTDEARQLLINARAATVKDDFGAALTFAEKAQLAARPTTEYLLNRAKSLENNADQAYKKEELTKAIELWRSSLEEYARVGELANKRSELDIIEALTSTVASIKGDIKTTFVELANKAVDEGKEKFEAKDFDTAKEKFEAARQLYGEGASVAHGLGSGDKEKIREMDAEMASSIEDCLIGKGEILFEEASREKGESKEDVCLGVMKYLESFSSDSQNYEELKTRVRDGLATARIETGLRLMADAETLLNQKEFYQAKNGYRKAQEYLENLRDYVVENRLEKVKGGVDNLIDDCAANIKVCTDSMLGRRETIAKGEIRKVEDLRKGIRLPVNAVRSSLSGPNNSSISFFPVELEELYYDASLIGNGGFARVFRARRKNDSTEVAVKTPLSMDASTGRSFVREITSWQVLNHKNIVKLHDLNVLPVPYLEMELCDGNLEDITKPIDVERASRLIFDIAEGLKYAHSKDIVHRDLKPSNILLHGDIPKIADWGLSKIASQDKDSKFSSFTTLYAAPEQLSPDKFGKTDQRTDIYQLGVIFYEIVIGEPPFKGDSITDVMAQIIMRQLKPPSERNPEAKVIEPIIMRCLEKEMSQRYQTIDQLQRDLAEYLKIEYQASLRINQGNMKRSGYYCSELCMVHLQIGDITGALKYVTDLKNYASGDVKAMLSQLIGELEYRHKEGLLVPDELVERASIVVHQAKIGH